MRHAAQNTLRIPNFLRRLGGCNPKLKLNRQYSGKRWKPSESTHKENSSQLRNVAESVDHEHQSSSILLRPNFARTSTRPLVKRRDSDLLQTLRSLVNMPDELEMDNSSRPGTPISTSQIHCADPGVERMLQQSLMVYDIPPQVRRDRIATLKRVQAMLYNAYKVRPYRVELFGSTLYGVSTPNSDLDMVILDPNRPQGQKIQEVAPIYAIRNLAKNFQRAGFTRVVAIPKAKVPIVKFHDPSTGLDGDINANDRLGLFNSRMIKHYCDIQPLLRPMLAFIKSWASPLGLNKPGIVDGPPTFSSYAFALMTIAFLQNIRLLPNLQDFTNTPVDSEQVFIHQNKPCHIQFRRIAPGAWLPPATLTLQEALYGWFKFWGTEYQYSVSRVDIRAGYYDVPPPSTTSSTTLNPEDKLRSKGLQVRLIDPFTHANVTDHIPAKAIETFRTECLHIMNLILPRSGTDPMSMSTTTPSPSSSFPPLSSPPTPPPPYPNTVDVKLARLRRLTREPAPEQSQSKHNAVGSSK
ncbi:poly polymerase cid13 [Lentinula edodes]|uniref:Poly polymerase cid13 n=1 Tax=Lentinula edodes TaxID=5353 RepID=A0A1Q3E614_LENED|nr:poly polymerase cid13 [Lentinula edodes]